jgi:hypothetical protein
MKFATAAGLEISLEPAEAFPFWLTRSFSGRLGRLRSHERPSSISGLGYFVHRRVWLKKTEGGHSRIVAAFIVYLPRDELFYATEFSRTRWKKSTAGK